MIECGCRKLFFFTFFLSSVDKFSGLKRQSQKPSATTFGAFFSATYSSLLNHIMLEVETPVSINHAPLELGAVTICQSARRDETLYTTVDELSQRSVEASLEIRNREWPAAGVVTPFRHVWTSIRSSLSLIGRANDSIQNAKRDQHANETRSRLVSHWLAYKLLSNQAAFSKGDLNSIGSNRG